VGSARPRDARDAVGSEVKSVVVVDDHPIYRDGLAQIVSSSGEFSLMGSFESVEALVREKEVPDLVLLDYHLAIGPIGPEAVAILVARGSLVLMVSADLGRTAVLETLAAGARGYVAKHASVDEVLGAIRLVLDTEHPGTYVSPALASFLLEAARGAETGRFKLSEREHEVLALVAAGERDQDIAELLFISVGTVRSHLDHIRNKTGQRRRADLTRYAIDQDLA